MRISPQAYQDGRKCVKMMGMIRGLNERTEMERGRGRDGKRKRRKEEEKSMCTKASKP